MIEPGEMNRRIIIQRATSAADTQGFMVPTWSTLAEVWAKVDWVSGKEVFKADRIIADSMLRILIRYRDLTTKDRISFDSKIWGIDYIKEYGTQEYLEVMATCLT